MTSIITRSALVFWGRNPAPDVASVVDGQIITWGEVMDTRRKNQRERLRRKRHVDEWRAHKLWVAYFGQDLMGGWHAFVEDIRGRDHRVWIDRDCRHLMPYLMKLFPLVLGLGSERDQWEMWKPEFAASFKRRRQHRQPLGVTALWWDRRHSPRLAA
jgi:hypothetical protein